MRTATCTRRKPGTREPHRSVSKHFYLRSFRQGVARPGAAGEQLEGAAGGSSRRRPVFQHRPTVMVLLRAASQVDGWHGARRRHREQNRQWQRPPAGRRSSSGVRWVGLSRLGHRRGHGRRESNNALPPNPSSNQPCPVPPRAHRLLSPARLGCADCRSGRICRAEDDHHWPGNHRW